MESRIETLISRISLGMALLLCFSHLSSTIRAQPVTSDTVRVYFLGGQSNMDGFGYSKDLPQELQMENKDVWIFHGNPVSDDLPHGGLGLWAPIRPVHGAGFPRKDGTSGHGYPGYQRRWEDRYPAIVRSTRYYSYSDPWHYDSEGYIDLGIQFAEALYRLKP